jgi:uncharacterized protein
MYSALSTIGGNVEHEPAQTRAYPTPRKRDLHFKLDASRIGDWNHGNAHLSHLMNSMSLFFPVGERFFIDSVRAYAADLPEDLRQPVREFIAQEALHGREHEHYNALFVERVPAARDAERRVAWLLRNFQKRAPKKAHLAATLALEHLTAIMAEGLLCDPHLHEGMEENYRDLWLWHALEKTEHKSVAFDVWNHVAGAGLLAYMRRCSALVHTTVMFALLATPTFLRAVAKEGALFHWTGWRLFASHMLGRVGFLRKLVLPWLSYFRPGFHPWDHDNRARLTLVDVLAQRHQRARRTAAVPA